MSALDFSKLLDKNKIQHISFTDYLKYFNPIKHLGSGGQGSVYLLKAANGRKYALKLIKLTDLGLHPRSDPRVKEALKEFKLLRKIGDSPHLVKFHYAFYTVIPSNEILIGIVMDLYTDFISWFIDHQNFKKVTYATVLKWFCQMVSALDTLHSKGILHRDIKLENMLIDPSTQNMFLTDFGMLCQGLRCDVKGTVGYLDPIAVADQVMSKTNDIFSLGVSFWIILTWPTLAESWSTPQLDSILRNALQNKLSKQDQQYVVHHHQTHFAHSLRPKFDLCNLWNVLVNMTTLTNIRWSTKELLNFCEAMCQGVNTNIPLVSGPAQIGFKRVVDKGGKVKFLPALMNHGAPVPSAKTALRPHSAPLHKRESHFRDQLFKLVQNHVPQSPHELHADKGDVVRLRHISKDPTHVVAKNVKNSNIGTLPISILSAVDSTETW